MKNGYKIILMIFLALSTFVIADEAEFLTDLIKQLRNSELGMSILVNRQYCHKLNFRCDDEARITAVYLEKVKRPEIMLPPDSISTLSKLEVLSIRDSVVKINWNVINSDPLKSRLKTLEIAGNRPGRIPDLNLPGLINLDISRSALGYYVTDPIVLSRSIRHINASNNYLQNNVIPFDQMPDLQTVDLSHNLLNDIPSFDKNPKLLVLNFSFNKIARELPSFDKNTKLTTIKLNHNLLTGKIPEFSKNTELMKLELSGNRLSSPIPKFKIESLLLIDISDNLLIGDIPKLHQPNLIFLDLSLNNLSGRVPDFIGYHALKFVNISNNDLVGELPEFPDSLRLQKLCVSFNKFRGVVPSFYKNNELRILDFSNNNLSGEFDLYRMTTVLMVSINGSNNKLSGKMPEFPERGSKLLSIDFSNNLLTGPTSSFRNCPRLELLNLSYNKLSGNISDFGSNTNLLHLDLSYNKFGGNIPDFRNSTSLQDLNVSNNELSGSIPSFSKNIKLKELNLSGNKLSGDIPNFDQNRDLVLLDLCKNGEFERKCIDENKEFIASTKLTKYTCTLGDIKIHKKCCTRLSFLLVCTVNHTLVTSNANAIYYAGSTVQISIILLGLLFV
ncbi:uncharacterized protein LOC126329976 isoform X1 [Schistocerca gregaria]|uniref:uncharacterized protein LOC126329976 isoform X1 n=1 Tax=Schistocerca gregaria TaxID=7010 RepID=UPI00211E0E32|nr:uncharacterized protein LOC126329976 isoform X1 [Schistocerca gregaria]